MFANRYTAFVDACTLARVLPRNLLLSLAEAEFFRLRWSAAVLDETEAAIAKILAAALKIRAETIVTENTKHFPGSVLMPLNMEVRNADAFIADTIALDPGRAVAAIRQMRERFKKPSMTGEDLLLHMEASALTETADVLRPHMLSI